MFGITIINVFNILKDNIQQVVKSGNSAFIHVNAISEKPLALFLSRRACSIFKPFIECILLVAYLSRIPSCSVKP